MAVKQELYLGNPNLKKANVSQKFTKRQIAEFLKCADDPVYFIQKYIKIVSLGFAKLFFKHCHSLPQHLNTLSKWKKELKKRIIEYTSVIHYAKNDKLIQTLKDIL